MTDPGTRPRTLSRTPARLRDLGLGVRFAAAGGREGWVRTLLTSVGVGIGVTLLLVASAVPHLLDERSHRSDARMESLASLAPDSNGKTDRTVLVKPIDTEFHNHAVQGTLMRADGSHPVLPAGLAHVPAAGRMYVSPALAELLKSSDARLLRERLPYAVEGTITDAGLVSPRELRFYLGSSTLTADNGGHRLTGYGNGLPVPPLDPLLVVLSVMVGVVLLMPVAIFIATAVRFGGERRDRRLAALRLVGADIGSVRWIAAGEALFGALLGLLAGAVFFLAGRPFVGSLSVWEQSVFPADLAPAAPLVALIVCAVPLCSLVVTLVAMRSVVVEPLGVVREGTGRRRRLWWRLLVPLAGLGIFAAQGRTGEDQTARPYPIVVGAVLVLLGLALLLPWLLEGCVNRLRGGPVPWQLAGRRLQLSAGTAARTVSGITVAVAGAVALQMLFAAMNADFNRLTGQDPTRAQFYMVSENVSGDGATRAIEELRATKGVKQVIGRVEVFATKPGTYTGDEVEPTTSITVGDCATLKELARITTCAEGDTFVAHPAHDQEMSDWVDESARKGEQVKIDSYRSGPDVRKPVYWTLPAGARTVTGRVDPHGEETTGILATRGAIDPATLPGATVVSEVRIDESVPEVSEYVRNTAARIDPTMRVVALNSTERDGRYASIQTAVKVGGTATLLLIGASMLVQQLEQLRERRRLLSVLVAFGTRRSTLGWSVLWQTAIPVAAGLVVAVAGGLALGWTLTWMTAKQVSDWWLFLPMTGVGGGLVLLVTLLSLPALWRLMRPDGLRTE
ncbi:ABC transporter permease [Streptomyces sp. NBC_01335]|uniref:FtsX-like permease family protein n=1 Tax=Streptomyces sp. NBC_01335 TaxID=2903828 RepID=UPI002E1122E4|nr:ABC transporter permease [Streptomyces sp. NBC_01335]